MKQRNDYKVRAATAVTAAALLLSAADLGAAEADRVLFDFQAADAARDWQTVNDNVMGGVSKGGFRLGGKGALTFSGTLSLENNGGFSSIRSRRKPTDLSDYAGLAIRVRGDGRTYWLTVYTDVRIPAGSHRVTFRTQPGRWQEIRVPFKSLRATSFGRELPLVPPPDPAKIQSVGFLLADKKVGPFRLDVDWIRAYRPGPAGDLVETAVAAGKFKTLLAAAKAAGLVEALKGPGPLTLFAPTDEAFAKLPAGALEDLLRPENRKKLTAILTRHVAPGRITLRKRSAATLEGSPLAIASRGDLRVDGATVLQADVPARNGVIHVIDRVLLPPPARGAGDESVAGRIELAVSRGAPLYNSGRVEACRDVYETTARDLLALPAGRVTEAERNRLSAALKEVAGDSTAREDAWTLRRALDAVYRTARARRDSL